MINLLEELEKNKSTLSTLEPYQLNCLDINSHFISQSKNDYFIHRSDPAEMVTKRDPFERDYTRILYSPSFRRLQGKMQLLGIKNDAFFRNRLTHSLEVSQIARSIARDVGYELNEIYVIEAGSLAHDLGNPPFGHFGERILNNIANDFGGYEGNAQSLRILTTLEKKVANQKGLNLTARTLLSILKYNNTYKKDGGDKQKFIYAEDYDTINQFVNENSIALRTLDVQIIDIADEIAYAAHDLEDGLSQGLFTINEILHEFKLTYPIDKDKIESKIKNGINITSKDVDTELTENIHVYSKLCLIIKEANDHANSATSSTQYSSMFNNKISSLITHELLKDIALMPVLDSTRSETKSSQQKEVGFKSLGKLSKGLKRITFTCVTNTNEIYHYEQAGRNVLYSLFELYTNHPKYLPTEYRLENSDTIKQNRLVIDYIGGMMDSYAINQYEKFFGRTALNGYYDVFNSLNSSCPFDKSANTK